MFKFQKKINKNMFSGENLKEKKKKYYDKYKKINQAGTEEGITAPNKMKLVLNMAKNLFRKQQKIKIADIGGTYFSFKLLKKYFPESEIWTANIVKEQMKKCENAICEDISNGISLKSQDFDFVFLGDVIEHFVEPEPPIKEINRILKNKGYFILTTPNLASLANRFSLLFGFAPSNYHPSEIRYGTLFGKKQSSWHKSVFTVRAMKEFLESFGFDIISNKGFSYQENKMILLIDGLLPTNFKEGMVILAQKTTKLNKKEN